MQIDQALLEQLKARNEAFASVAERQSPSELLPILQFLIDQEHYVLEQRFVREVKPLKQITRIPQAPDWVRGITSVRGRVICVVDLRRLFGLPQHNLSDKNFLLILHYKDHEIGLLVDRIHGIQTIRKSDIQDPQSMANGVPIQFIQGLLPSIGNTQQRQVLLDGNALLRDLTGRKLS